MKNRALIGLSAACMSALVATAVGCGEPAVDPYTPPAEEETAVETAVTEEPAAEEETTAEAEADATEETEAADAEAEEESTTGTTTSSSSASSPSTASSSTTSTSADKADEKDADAGKADGAASADGEYADGTYEASGKGIGGDVPVTVTVKDGKVAEVTVGDNSETQGIGSNAIEQLPALIVEAGGTEGVEGGSGATVTSNAILDAVETALEGASR